MGIFQVIPVRTEAMSDYPPTGMGESVRALPEWIQFGCGDAEYVCAEKNATFLGGNMPDKLPDLSNHSSFFAEVMRENPGLYDKLKTKNTKLGVTFGHGIKTGVDNPGHPMIKTVGAVAGDEESYELFREFFDPVISARHGGYAADAKHPTDMNPANLSKTPIDPTGKYVLTTRCRTTYCSRSHQFGLVLFQYFKASIVYIFINCAFLQTNFQHQLLLAQLICICQLFFSKLAFFHFSFQPI